EQETTHLVLEPAYGARDRRLCDGACDGGAAEASLADDGEEIANLMHFHGGLCDSRLEKCGALKPGAIMQLFKNWLESTLLTPVQAFAIERHEPADGGHSATRRMPSNASALRSKPRRPAIVNDAR